MVTSLDLIARHSQAVSSAALSLRTEVSAVRLQQPTQRASHGQGRALTLRAATIKSATGGHASLRATCLLWLRASSSIPVRRERPRRQADLLEEQRPWLGWARR